MERKNFGKLRNVLEIPDLISVQTDSYEAFLQRNVPPMERKRQGLQELFMEIFPIKSFDGQLLLEFVSYEIGDCHPSKSNIINCIKDGKTYDAPLFVNFLLKAHGVETLERVQMADIPIMTEQGTFVINGAERVIISQLHRSPGLCFEKSKHASGKTLYSFRIIPDRGSWMDVEFDQYEVMQIYLDRRRRRRKFNLATFLRTIDLPTNRDIISKFNDIKEMSIADLEEEKLKKAKLSLSELYTIDKILDENGAEVVDELKEMNDAELAKLKDHNIKSAEFAIVKDKKNYLFTTIKKDTTRNELDALKEVYHRLRPGDPFNEENARQLVRRLFFDSRRYNLGEVGRYKLNQRLHSKEDEDGNLIPINPVPMDVRVLDLSDFIDATKMLLDLRHRNDGKVDDIDHLGARRVRTVGELLQNQCRAGLLRTERFIREKLAGNEEKLTPSKIVSSKAFATLVRDFFVRNQLSQFMDQTNPLSELTNKRRLSALGPGGLSRDRAGFEVRDVHSSHYGRICPIETPEGPNIGLISSMSLYAVVDKYGFLETPYRKVVDGRVTDQIDYLTADNEEKFVIAQANAPLDENNAFINNMVMCRFKGDSAMYEREKVQYMDVSPKQLVSAAAGVIPFLEHDDANRALMGSNMQRQAVSLLMPESPYVGTGLEAKIARDSRAIVVAKEDGIVAEVSSDHICVTPDGKMPESGEIPKDGRRYELYKYLRSNAGTCINQRPVVRTGDVVKKGDLIADGAATQGGELALGRNVLVAFMPWCGYNFEDAIIVSERLVNDDVYTSVHVDSFDVTCGENKLGPEEITRDIPNVGEGKLRNLDDEGVVIVGAEVGPGDILVGKITPKSEIEQAPEERLLRAIFGEKATDVKDSSLLVPSGKGGIVMDVRVERVKNTVVKSRAELTQKRKGIIQDCDDRRSLLMEELSACLSEVLAGVKLQAPITITEEDGTETTLVPPNHKVSKSAIKNLVMHCESKTWNMGECEKRKEVAEIINKFVGKLKDNEDNRCRLLREIDTPENEKPGIIKKVRVYVGCKRKLQIGDKMAGRHGNKGIVSRIVPVADMPYLENGMPVDIILNPLGVPSRMNIGQVLETHLGMAVKILGFKAATPVFDGVTEEQIVNLMKQANQKYTKEHGRDYHWGFRQDKNGEYTIYDGKTNVYDGRTGDKFDQRVMVGQIYMLKLDHLVANKIHSRAVGPYSLVTQQPLGGKAQQGGQRFGEMEVWALEAYGAAYTLQEMLTVKSDDREGRTRIYNSIVAGRNVLEAGRPESFNVLLKEMKSLGLDISIVDTKKKEN